MTINNKFTTTDYRRDTEALEAYRFMNGTNAKPAETKTEKKPAANDGFKSANPEVLATKTDNKQYVKSNLTIDLEDKDGFANFGKADIRAKVSGDVTITKDLILEQLSKMKDKPDQKFNPPRFDAERQHFVISGKAMDAALGFIDINFEIRVGIKEEGLAFIVDSALTRGSIYSDLKNQMLDAGIDTYEKNGTLYIKPTLGQSFDVPVSKEKNHTARIEWINTNAQNTKTTIDKFGNVQVKLDKVQMIASSDINKINPKASKSDVASIKFDFSLDDQMKPTATFKDGSLNASVDEKNVEELIGKENMSYMKQMFGTALSVSLTGLGGHIEMKDGSLAFEAQTNVAVKAEDTGADISSDVKISLADSKPIIQADRFNANLNGEQKIIADHILYDGTKEGVNVDVQGLDAKVNIEGVKAEVKGNAGVVADTSGNISGSFAGETKGNINRDAIDVNFDTKGLHTVSVGGDQINIEVDKVRVDGKYDTTTRHKEITIKEKKSGEETPIESKKAPRNINVKVNDVDVSGAIKTQDVGIAANLKDGSVSAQIGKDVKITTDATVSGTAKGEKINGEITAKGADFSLNEDGSVEVNANTVKADGGFHNKDKELKIGGKIDADVNLKISNKFDVEVQASNGTVDGAFSKGKQIDVKASVKEVGLTMDSNQENISIDLDGVDGTTKFVKNKIKLTAKTKGDVDINLTEGGDRVNIKTDKATSTADLSVKNGMVKVKGTTGDVNVDIKSVGDGDAVTVDIKDARMKGSVTPESGKINVGIDTKADARVYVSPNSEVIDITSKNADTKVHFKHNVADVHAQGTDFAVKITNDEDVAVNLKDATFSGKINSKDKIKVDIDSTSSSEVKVDVKGGGDNVSVSSGSDLKGEARIGPEAKFSSKFDNKGGFNLDISKSDEEATVIDAKVNGININGGFNTENIGVGLKGKGDFSLNLVDKTESSDVKITYNGNAYGEADVKGRGIGGYDLGGEVKIDISGDNINVNANAEVNAQFKDKTGIGADVKLRSTKEQPIKVSVNEATGGVDVDLERGGYIVLKNIDQLDFGPEPDPTVKILLENIKSKSTKVTFQKLAIGNSAENLSVNVQSKGIATTYGNVSTSVKVEKEGSEFQLNQSYVSLQPNAEFFKAIQNAVGKNFKINFDEAPRIENGELKMKGELKSKLGLVQYADFNINATVVDNELVLDLNRAKVFKVIGEGTIGKIADWALSKADIDATRIGKNTIKITLADIVKDLSLTEGINFTELKFKDDKIQIGLKFNSIDKKISGFAKKEDISGLYDYMKTVNYQKISSEGLATAYQTYTKDKDVEKASDLMTKVVTVYNKDTEIDKKDYERALVWISRNQSAKKAHIDDNVTIEFTKKIGLNTPYGDALIKGLPKLVVQNLADNLDQTLSQGGGFSIIYPSERNAANYMRELKGIPANKKPF